MCMDKLSRVIFALLFLLASTSSRIGARGPSVIAPVTAAKAQGRSLVIVPVTRPVLVHDSIQIDERPLADLSDRADKEKFAGAPLQITETGAVCEGYRLDFSEVIMKDDMAREHV